MLTNKKQYDGYKKKLLAIFTVGFFRIYLNEH